MYHLLQFIDAIAKASPINKTHSGSPNQQQTLAVDMQKKSAQKWLQSEWRLELGEI
jgi:hypothetical protein